MGRDQMKSASRHSFHDGPRRRRRGAGRRVRESGARRCWCSWARIPAREGLRNTPARVAASLRWLTRGYQMSVEDVIGDAVFEEKHENMILVRDIEIYSLCEHHMLPFFGRAHVAYLPNGRIVGLSKIPRVVEVFARRLQVQERLTDQIADALCEVLQPLGVGVVIEAYHLCMMMRGVEKQNSKTVTSALRGHLPRRRQDARRVPAPGARRRQLAAVTAGAGRSRAGSRSSPAPRAASASRSRTSCGPPARTWCASRARLADGAGDRETTLHCDVTRADDVERAVTTRAWRSSACPTSS